MNLAYLLYKAYHYFLKGEPFPLDLCIALASEDIEPSELEERFTDGHYPEGAEAIEPDDDPEEADYSTIDGSIESLLVTLRRASRILDSALTRRT